MRYWGYRSDQDCFGPYHGFTVSGMGVGVTDPLPVTAQVIIRARMGKLKQRGQDHETFGLRGLRAVVGKHSPEFSGPR